MQHFKFKLQKAVFNILRAALYAALSTTLISICSTHAQVKQQLYNTANNYPYEAGWPFRTVPEFRHGALTGKGLHDRFQNNTAYWLPTKPAARAIPQQPVSWSIWNNPQDVLKKHAITAMLLYKEGHLVFETYQYGTQVNTLFDVQSIAKTMTALTMGAAFTQGAMPPIDSVLQTVVPALQGSPIGKATILQALQMQCGHAFKWVDDGPDASAGAYAGVRFAAKGGRARDLLTYFQTLPAVAPGSVFAYDPHCSDALAMVLSKVTGQAHIHYFAQHIWKKLPSSDTGVWLSPTMNPELTSGASGLYLTAYDLLQLAQLFLTQGKVGDATVINPEWLQHMAAHTVDVGNYPSNFKRYGYQTWVRHADKQSWFAGLGNYGQRMYVDPQTQSIMILFALDQDHISDTDRFWEYFRMKPLKDLKN